MKCLATVHGPVRGRGRGAIQRPRGPAIEQLIAEECGEMFLTRSQEDLDDSEDAEEGYVEIFGLLHHWPFLSTDILSDGTDFIPFSIKLRSSF